LKPPSFCTKGFEYIELAREKISMADRALLNVFRALFAYTILIQRDLNTLILPVKEPQKLERITTTCFE